MSGQQEGPPRVPSRTSTRVPPRPLFTIPHLHRHIGRASRRTPALLAPPRRRSRHSTSQGVCSASAPLTGFPSPD